MGTVMRTSVILILTTFFLGVESFAVSTVEPVIDKELLSYQFRTHRTITLHDPDGAYQPLRYSDQERLGIYEVANHWKDDSLSFVVFRSDILTGSAINQANRNVWSFMTYHAADLNGDGGEEVIVCYLDDPHVWLEIIDVSGEINYKRLLLTPEDHNQNGRWDGGVHAMATSDLNGDGFAECLITVFSGFDLYPRGLYCLDWKNDSLLWIREFSGLPGHPVLVENSNGAVSILLAQCSMGNAVTTATMDDQHSYVLCIDAAGQLLWSKTLGEIFSWSWVIAIDTDDDGIKEALTWTNPSSVDDSASVQEQGALLRVYELDGTPGKSLRLPSGVVIRHLILGDLNRDSYDEIIVSSSDRHVTVYDRQLNELNRFLFPAEVELFKCADFLGTGSMQLIVSTVSGKTMLLSNSFDLLAQTDDMFDFRGCFDFMAAFAEPGRALMMRDQNQPLMHALYFEKQPFLTILGNFLIRNKQTLIGLFVALVVALVFTNYHRRKISHNLEIISSQRDKLKQTHNELQKTLDDLKAAQTRLVQSEKMMSLGMLVAGIAHEINSPLGAMSSSNNTAARILSLLRRQLGQAGITPETEVELLKSLEALENANSSVQTGVDKIDRIVSKLRSFARLDEAELQKASVAECLDETLGLLHPRMRKRVLLNKQYDDLPEIPCYPGYLNQVFLNVLINAIEAIPDRGEITIKTYSEESAVIIRISDTGAGIPSEHIQKVFDPGYTTKGVGVGTGMGLAICYQIVQDHKGEISIESEIGSGTTVTIRLPLELK